MPSDAAVPPTMRRLTAIAGAMACVYLAAGWVWLHPQAVGVARWPTLWMVAIYLIASLAWLAAIVTAVRLDLSDPAVRARLLRTIVAAALCFRVIHLAIPPILELDVYRYMWDGIVSNAGVSPYRYSPAQVLANDTSVTDPTYRGRHRGGAPIADASSDFGARSFSRVHDVVPAGKSARVRSGDGDCSGLGQRHDASRGDETHAHPV